MLQTGDFGLEVVHAAGKFLDAVLGADSTDNEPDGEGNGNPENQQDDKWQCVHSVTFRLSVGCGRTTTILIL